MSGPFEGLKVVDFSELLPGPFLTQSLVELGATVIKAERPQVGDAVRRMAPGLFTAVNRGKHSVVVDLKSPQGVDNALALLRDADVMVDSYRPGVMKRLGLGYEAVAAVNPRIVYASLTGFGQTGPDAMVPGHDINYLAASGVLALAPEGSPGGGLPIPVADLAGATYALAAVSAALYQRHATGRGQYLDVALTDCLAHWLNPRLANFHHAKLTTIETQRGLVRGRPAYGVFQCKDGRISLAVLEDHFWRNFVKVLPMSPFDTPEFEDRRHRETHALEINDRVNQSLADWTVHHAMRRFVDADVPAAPMVLPSDLASNEQMQARGLVTATDAGPLIRFPVRMEGMATTPTSAPLLGERSR